MSVEFAELAAGLPVALSLAMASGISVLREGRRRASLNQAMHEVRRPLQALALSLPPGAEVSEASFQMAVTAIERLDHEINGKPPARVVTMVPGRVLVEEAARRWQRQTSLLAGEVNLRWQAGDVFVSGDEVELRQALDNMINNALEHGEGEVVIVAQRVPGMLRVTVSNADANRSLRQHHAGLRARLSGRRRHGYGIKIVGRIAARHGGSFQFRRFPGGCEACLELPLSGVGQ
ncbi:MAG TPA: ATP-binding protein [Solirubrobacterales bacterium]